MDPHLKILESGISDVGYWRWWTANLPESFQLEFGGTQFWSAPPSPDAPPSGLIALRLVRPSAVVFLRAPNADLPDDWHESMHRDELQPFGLDRERFTLSSFDLAETYLGQAARTHALIGSATACNARDGLSVVSFWAGRAGFYGVGEALTVLNTQGELAAEQIESANRQWWGYWREYWRQTDGPMPMPNDYGCEVTIPLKSG